VQPVTAERADTKIEVNDCKSYSKILGENQKLVQIRFLTRSSAVAERLHDASCH